jgi:hypothetical protein
MIEVHAGVGFSAVATGDSGNLPPSVNLAGFRASATSFYFGQGTQLFNQNVQTRLGPAAPSIVPLDPVLLGNSVAQSRAFAIGARLSRTVWRRLGAEITAESGPGDFSFTTTALAGLEATRASYQPALQRVLASASPVAASITTLTDKQSPTQLVLTGSLVVDLREKAARLVPYVMGGAGVLSSAGDMPTATLTGLFTYGVGSWINSTDAVNIRYGLTHFTPVGVGGGGVRYAMGRQWGLRFDARAYAYRSPVQTLLNANPSTVMQSAGVPFPLINVGALQFSTTGSLSGISISAVPGTTFASTSTTTSTLPPGFVTWSNARTAHLTPTVGLYWRF